MLKESIEWSISKRPQKAQCTLFLDLDITLCAALYMGEEGMLAIII